MDLWLFGGVGGKGKGWGGVGTVELLLLHVVLVCFEEGGGVKGKGGGSNRAPTHL